MPRATRVDVGRPNEPPLRLPVTRTWREFQLVGEPATPHRAARPGGSNRTASRGVPAQHRSGCRVGASPCRCRLHRWYGCTLSAPLVHFPATDQTSQEQGAAIPWRASRRQVPWWLEASCSSGQRPSPSVPPLSAARQGPAMHLREHRIRRAQQEQTAVPTPAREERARAALVNPWYADRSRAFEGRSCLC